MESVIFDKRDAMRVKCEDGDIGYNKRPGAAIYSIPFNTQREDVY